MLFKFCLQYLNQVILLVLLIINIYSVWTRDFVSEAAKKLYPDEDKREAFMMRILESGRSIEERDLWYELIRNTDLILGTNYLLLMIILE